MGKRDGRGKKCPLKSLKVPKPEFSFKSQKKRLEMSFSTFHPEKWNEIKEGDLHKREGDIL